RKLTRQSSFQRTQEKEIWSANMPVMTVYVAKAGTQLGTGGTSTVGHMWFSLSSDGSSPGTSYGFAPINHGVPFGAGQIYGNDVSNYQSYDYVKSFYVTQAQYDTLKAFGDNPASGNFSLFYNMFA